MDDLTKIIITAVVSVIGKELLTWLVGRIKSKQIGSKVKSTLDRWAVSGMAFMWIDIIAISFFSVFLYRVIVDPSPLSRVVVFTIALYTGIIVYWMGEFFRDFRDYKLKPRREQWQKLERQIEIDNRITMVISEMTEKLKANPLYLPPAEKDAVSAITSTSKKEEKIKE